MQPTSTRRWGYCALAMLLLTMGCAASLNPLVGTATPGKEPAGFLLGLWHGLIVWVTFVVSLFTQDVAVYEVHNGGWPYDLGFLIGVSSVLGGGAAGSRRRWRGTGSR